MAFDPHVPEIAGVIQLAIAPVFMLTAVGTVIGALNIRLGRAVDRRRELEERVPSMAQAELPSAQEELATIARRIRFVYLSIVFAVISALFVALLIAGAFVGAFVRTDLSLTIAGHVHLRHAGADRLPAAVPERDLPGGIDPAARAAVIWFRRQ